MKLNVLYFGNLLDVTGKPSEEIEATGLTDIADLNEHLHAIYPTLAMQKYKVAVNQKIVDASQSIKDGDEIALLPPFAGG